MKRSLLALIALIVLIPAGLWLNWQLATPSHDRDWRADHSRLPRVSEAGGIWTVADLRNWDYAADGTVTAERWTDARIDPATLLQASFLVEPFGGNAAIAHTMLSFRFDDGSAYVASVEARREEGEVYSAPKAAVLPVFETMFVWTTERDMFGNSEFFADDRLYLYPLAIPLDQQRAVLQAMLRETAAVQAQPRWYNTLFSNCTNALARAVNRLKPGAVPLDKAWVLTGYADSFLFAQGMLADAGGFEATQDKAFISPLIRELYGIADPAAFSRALWLRMSGRG